MIVKEIQEKFQFYEQTDDDDKDEDEEDKYLIHEWENGKIKKKEGRKKKRRKRFDMIDRNQRVEEHEFHDTKPKKEISMTFISLLKYQTNRRKKQLPPHKTDKTGYLDTQVARAGGPGQWWERSIWAGAVMQKTKKTNQKYPKAKYDWPTD